MRFAPLWLVPTLASASAWAQEKPAPITPKETVKLFNGKDLTGFTSWLRDTKREDPKKVYSVVDGAIRIAGMPMGYLATEKEYENYRLTLDFKWGKETYGAKGVRNSGILLHMTGPDNVWPASIECQLAQGCIGDFIAIRGKDAAGGAIPTKFMGEVELGPDKRPRWKKGGTPREFPKGQMWWSLHEPFFKEDIDTRGKNDVDSPLGEWTRMEVICDGRRITVKVNGTTVNECYDAFPCSGKILLQSEGFEIWFRNVELHPLK
jgi:hypothetical protein